MDILRIATAGSVDDGKSTLIGRLLYDTKSITRDKLEAVELSSRRKGLDFTDLSLLTDGLIAEREQGITIDVAHIYFSTQNRKYIIAEKLLSTLNRRAGLGRAVGLAVNADDLFKNGESEAALEVVNLPRFVQPAKSQCGLVRRHSLVNAIGTRVQVTQRDLKL